MPGHVSKQSAPAPNAVDICDVGPMISFPSVSQASVDEILGACNKVVNKYSENTFNSEDPKYLID